MQGRSSGVVDVARTAPPRRDSSRTVSMFGAQDHTGVCALEQARWSLARVYRGIARVTRRPARRTHRRRRTGGTIVPKTGRYRQPLNG
jgi:hypothetical protein